MKYAVKFTSQFKKDLKLAKSKARTWTGFLRSGIFLLKAASSIPRTMTMNFPESTRGRANAISNLTGFCYMRSGGDILVLMLYRLGSHAELFKR